MDLEWQLDNPAIALKKYFEDNEVFMMKKSRNEVLNMELAAKENELEDKINNLQEKSSRLQDMEEYAGNDIGNRITILYEEMLDKINLASEDYDKKKKALAMQQQKAISDNDLWLSERLKQLWGNNAEVNRELTEVEQKALEYEIERRDFSNNSNEKIDNYKDALVQEDLECQTIVGEWKQKQHEIFVKFEPDVTKYKKIIDNINRKYASEISQAKRFLDEKIAIRDEEISQLQLEKSREIKLANDEIQGFRNEYAKTEKSYNEQIRMAKIQNKPTTRMENSKVSRLNSINDHIQKINNKLNRKIMGIEQKIEVESSKHAKQIDKAEEQLQNIIGKKNQELNVPTNSINELINDRDSQIEALQLQINKREQEKKNKVGHLQNCILAEEGMQAQHNLEIDKKMVAFVMNGNTCFSDVLNETNAPFIALQKRVNIWMELLTTIKKDKMSAAYLAEHDIQKNNLKTKSYAELQSELIEAQQFNDTISSLVKNNATFTMIGGALAGTGVVLFLILYCLMGGMVGVVGLLTAIVGIALVVLVSIKTKTEFATICKYISLAYDYKDFPEIASYSTQVTQDRELASMKEKGRKLYDIHFGKEEAQKLHDAKEADIRLDYERNIELIKVELKNAQDQYEMEHDNSTEKILADAAEEENKFIAEKEELQNEVDNLSNRINILEKRIKDVRVEIKQNCEYINAFELNYKTLEKKLNDDKWMAPMDYTHGKLSDELYIIQENLALDQYGHKKIFKITHNKKPLVVTYDISGIESGDNSIVEEMGKIIQGILIDLMYSIYRMNSKETYAQYVVDEVGGANNLKSTSYKNAFSIREVVGKLDDIKGRLREFALQREMFAQKGTRIDDVNENKYKHQERPEEYKILYLIYKPNERKSKIDEDIRKLMPECDKYGFFPIFICEAGTWEEGIQAKESNYRDIKSFVSNEIINFDGFSYS